MKQTNKLCLHLQIDFVRDLSTLGVKYRLLDMVGLEKLKDSRPEEPCPFFIQPHHRRRKRSSQDDEKDHHEG